MRYGELALSKKPQGFAALPPEERKRIASKGGRSAHEQGKAHEFTSETGRRAGSLGGKAVSADREYMAEIGRRGGQTKSRNKKGKDQ